MRYYAKSLVGDVDWNGGLPGSWLKPPHPCTSKLGAGKKHCFFVTTLFGQTMFSSAGLYGSGIFGV